MDRDDDRYQPSTLYDFAVATSRRDVPRPEINQEIRQWVVEKREETNDWHGIKSFYLNLPLFIKRDAQREAREWDVAQCFARTLSEDRLQARFEGRGWDALLVDEKLSVFTQLEDVTARHEKRIKTQVRTGWLEMGAGYDWQHNVIMLNQTLLDAEPKWMSVWAFMHEQAHAFQNAAIRNSWRYPELDKQQVAAWRNNFDNYIVPPGDPVRIWDCIRYSFYVLQPVERDAIARQLLRFRMYNALAT